MAAPQYELLAPAGNWECARAAVANGANAIYFGLNSGFNARARADNFTPTDLPALMQFLHRHQVRGYVTLNTLIFPEELSTAEDLVREIAEAGVDAVLVQDLGFVQLIRATAPSLPIHASTQMTLTSAECIAVVAETGIERIVLARELSLQEIRHIHEATSMPLEAFVHGALCVAYSGQCLTSESLGGRSANRGQCAQACRLPYELLCDGDEVPTGAQKYLLSPQDLAAYALLPELMAAGITSFKIEGRLKTPEYVANITRHYREALDSAIAGEPVQFTPLQIEEMELSFSRGFSVGWLKGCDHKALVPALRSAKQGVLVGKIERIDAATGEVTLKLCGSLKAGDGIVFAGDRLTGEELGGRVFAMTERGRECSGSMNSGRVTITLFQHAVDVTRLHAGQEVWKNDDPALTSRLRKSFAGEIPEPPRPVRIFAEARPGEPLKLQVQSGEEAAFTIVSAQPLQQAVKHPLTVEVLTAQFGRLGGTGFVLTDLQAEISGDVMLPLSQLGLMRREMVARLQQIPEPQPEEICRIAAERQLPRLREMLGIGVSGFGIRDSGQLPRPGETLPQKTVEATQSAPQLTVLCRSLTQLEGLLSLEMPEVTVDFQDIREYRAAIEMSQGSPTRLWLATPRIQKPGEMGIFQAIAKREPQGVLVRNLAGLRFFREREIPVVADFSLNAANELTVAWLLQHGPERVTVSYDLNQDQILGLIEQAPADRLEVVVHQHMPMFHMEHCVFCAMLSPGTNKTNCGRPCDRHVVELRDRVGAVHPLKADVGCRNTLFNSTPQSGAELIEPLLERGVRYFRIELLHDAPVSELEKIMVQYLQLLNGTISAAQVWQTLNAMNRIGVTRGTLEHDRNPLAIL